jgi:hypothetical protein
MYTREMPDYTDQDGNGGTAGVDIGPIPKFPLRTALEGRFTITGGGAHGLQYHSYVFGPRAEVKVSRLHPYGNFLIGYGTVSFYNIFGSAYPNDNSVVYSPGAGVDMDLKGGFQAKVDWQYQFWDLGHAVPHSFTLNPSTISGGFAYRFGPR